MNSRELGGRDAYRSPSAAAGTTPTVCPVCQSSAITTTARKPDESTYWRCGGCGEIWNASRRGTALRGGHRWQ
jgi:transposase-like protein